MGTEGRKPTYDELVALVARLEARIAELERQLAAATQNSRKRLQAALNEEYRNRLFFQT